jgi:hypothetical protein
LIRPAGYILFNELSFVSDAYFQPLKQHSQLSKVPSYRLQFQSLLEAAGIVFQLKKLMTSFVYDSQSKLSEPAF